MKSIFVIIGVLLSPFSYTLANNGNDSDGEKKKGKTDTTVVAGERGETESAFEVRFENNTVEVIASGDFDPYASISLTTNRGSDIFFSFLQKGSNVISFDTSDLENGSYFIILNSNEEVRIKRFQLD